MLATLVVEDEPAARAKLLDWLTEESDIRIVAALGDFAAASQVIAEHSIDLAFLDIEIGNGSGLDLALQLSPPASVVFVTAYDAHAVRAFDLNAVDYLLKPYTRARLQQALERIRARLDTRTTAPGGPGGPVRTPGEPATATPPENLLLKSVDRFVSVRLDDIAWVEADDNYLKLHASRLFHERITLSAFLSKFPDRFLQIHRSYAVQVNCVHEVYRRVGSDPVVRLRNGHELRVSRRFAGALAQRLPRL